MPKSLQREFLELLMSFHPTPEELRVGLRFAAKIGKLEQKLEAHVNLIPDLPDRAISCESSDV